MNAEHLISARSKITDIRADLIKIKQFDISNELALRTFAAMAALDKLNTVIGVELAKLPPPPPKTESEPVTEAKEPKKVARKSFSSILNVFKFHTNMKQRLTKSNAPQGKMRKMRNYEAVKFCEDNGYMIVGDWSHIMLGKEPTSAISNDLRWTSDGGINRSPFPRVPIVPDVIMKAVAMETINEFVNRCIDTAKQKNCLVLCEFNSFLFKVASHSEPTSIADRYLRYAHEID